MRGTRIPIVFVSLCILYFCSVITINGFTEEATRHCIRISARVSFIFFCLAFIASGFQYQIRNEFSFWLIMNRKFLGITFGIIHLIHLSLLGILQLQFHPVFEMAETTSLLGGGGAYFFISIMLITSADIIKKKMSHKVWKSIHTLGMYWIAAVFLTSYTSRVLSEKEYVPLLSFLLIGLLLRIIKLTSYRIFK